MRVAMLKKTSADVKKRIAFFIDFSSIFRGKSTENRSKSVKTSFMHKNWEKKKSRLERRFLAKNRFLANFWALPGSPGASRDDPENSQNRSFFSFMVNCAWKRARTASGRPQEGPRGPPRRPQGTILHRFSDRFCTSKTNENIQKSVENNSKTLEELVTLIRATVNSWWTDR